MGLFDRKVKRRTQRKSPPRDDAGEDAPKLGPVSTVLTETRNEASADDPAREDIVQRRFGPASTEGIDLGKNLPPKRKKKEPEIIEPISPELVAPVDFADTSQLDSPELEVDPMAHIGSSTTITGDIVAEEDIEILGTVEGTVMLANHRVSIGDGGLVKGEVHSGAVVVIGKVEGDIEATDVVEVRAGGYVGGNVKCSRIILHDGAILCGGLDMSQALSGAGKAAAPKVESTKEQPVVQVKEPKKIHTSAEPTKPTLKRVEVLPPEKANVRR